MKWTSQELECFLKGLERYGKEFSKISKEIISKTTGECVQMYYFWKKLCVDYKVTHLKTETPPQTNHTADPKPYVCEIPDCSASFSSKAALHGHTRIHTYGRNNAQHNNNNNSNSNSNSNNNNSNSSNNNNNPNANHASTFLQGSANHNHHHHHNQNHNQNQLHNNPLHHSNNSINNSNNSNNNSSHPANTNSSHAAANNQKDPNNATKDNIEFPCKVCGNEDSLLIEVFSQKH